VKTTTLIRNSGATVLLVLLIFLSGSTPGIAEVQPGTKLPSFKLPALDGKNIASNDYVGKVLLVHLWKCR